MTKGKLLLGVCALVLCMANQGGCENSDSQQGQAQEELNQRSNMAVGMPNIVNFAEKRMMKDILELRDQMHPTYTYLVSLNGSVGDKICDSVGYGLPYATQFTNPQKITDGGHVLSQADPNALFSPSSADGTWVLCKDLTPGSSKVLPVYIEPRIIVSPFKLK